MLLRAAILQGNWDWILDTKREKCPFGLEEMKLFTLNVLTLKVLTLKALIRTFQTLS